MHPSSRIAQVYGYAVCLIAVVVFLIAASNIVEAAFDRSEPLLSERWSGRADGDLSSFEAYRASRAERTAPTPERPGAAPSTDTMSTADLRARYEALRAQQIASVRFQSTRRLVKHGFLLVVAFGLFMTHWRWLRRREDAPA